MAERMERGMAGKIAGKTAKRMDTGSGTESRKAVDGDKDRAKDSKHKVRDGEGKTGVGKSGKRFAEDGDALSKQRSGKTQGWQFAKRAQRDGWIVCTKNKMEGD